MPMTRRDALQAGAGAALSLGTSGLLAQSDRPILKTIPSSGETIAPIGIGTNRYGVGESEDERAPLRATMARFAELGGQVIDTAAAYGTSEAVIGDLAAELGIRNDLFLVTKTDIRGRIRGVDGFRNSFERLRSEQIDLMMVHQLVNTDTELPLLREWKAASRFRYIGASVSSRDQHEEMEQFMLAEDVDFVQFNYSLGDRDAAERLLPTAADRGIAVMLNLPFGGARRSIFSVVEGQELPDWATEFDCASWAQFFLKYLISHPAVTCPIPGTRQVRHVNDNFGAAFGRLPDAELRRRQEELFDSLA